MVDMPTAIEPDAESFDGARGRGGSSASAPAIPSERPHRGNRTRERRSSDLEWTAGPGREPQQAYLWGLREAQATTPLHRRAMEEIRGELLERRGIDVVCARVLMSAL